MLHQNVNSNKRRTPCCTILRCRYFSKRCFLVHPFFHKTFFIRIPVAQRRTVILHCFYFPKSRKSELHNVLHGVRVNLKFCSFNTLLLCRIIDTFTLYSYNWLLNVKTVIIVLSCLNVAKKLSDFCNWNLRKSVRTFPGWNCPKIKNNLNPVPNRVNTIQS